MSRQTWRRRSLKFEIINLKSQILIGLLCCAVTHLTAQQLYTDTFKLAEQDKAVNVDMDAMLLDLVKAQGEQIYERDSVDLQTIAEYLRQDSIRREEAEIDSLRNVNAALAVQRLQRTSRTIEIEKSWIKDAEEDRNDVLQAIREMRSPWRREATLMAQITQNYVTDNWYQGGSSSFAGYGIAKAICHYITDEFTWENTGEWRMGGSTVSNDSLHKVNTTDDLFRIYSKANFRIVPKVFTSISVDFETRLLPTYKTNSNVLKSAPFAPLRFTAAFGIDYKPVKNLSISFSPLSYKVIHINDTARVKATDYGLLKGEKTQHNVGSSVRIEYLWKPVREVALETKFYTYTNYRNVEIDLEVNCDFIINRFLTARVVLHPRYDTSVIKDGETRARIQFRELVSVGFSHKFR